MRSYLEAYRDLTGATILLASHNMSEVERMGNEVLMMKTGNIIDQGTPKDLIEKYRRDTLEEVFLDISRSDQNAVIGAK